MDDSELDEGAFVSRVAEEIIRQMRAQLYPRKYTFQLRDLASMSEKLVYQHIMYNQPLTFTEIKRNLGLGNRTVSRALKRLMARRLVVYDRYFRYWLRRLNHENESPTPSRDERGKV